MFARIEELRRAGTIPAPQVLMISEHSSLWLQEAVLILAYRLAASMRFPTLIRENEGARSDVRECGDGVLVICDAVDSGRNCEQLLRTLHTLQVYPATTVVAALSAKGVEKLSIQNREYA